MPHQYIKMKLTRRIAKESNNNNMNYSALGNMDLNNEILVRNNSEAQNLRAYKK